MTEVPRVLTLKRAGFWQPDETDAHFLELERRVAAQRLRHGRARVLIDLTEAMVQAQPNVSSISDGARRSYRTGDKVALVVASALLGLQVKRIESAADIQVFGAVDEALRWLD